MNSQLPTSLKLRCLPTHTLVLFIQNYTNIASSLWHLYPYTPTEGYSSLWYRTLSAHPRTLFKFQSSIILLRF